MSTSTHYEIAGASIPLKGKSRNGDHFKVATTPQGTAILVVADGVGSAPCDHLASELSCTLAVAELLKASTESWPIRIEAAVRAANAELLLQDGACAGLKCTVVLAVWDSSADELHYTSLGDSRLYARIAGTWKALTTDQRKAVVRRGPDGKPLRMAGAVVIAEGVTHVLGVHLNEPIEVTTISTHDISAVALCTDGFLDTPSDPEEVLESLMRASDLEAGLTRAIKDLTEFQRDDLTLLCARKRTTNGGSDRLLLQLRQGSQITELDPIELIGGMRAVLPVLVGQGEHDAVGRALEHCADLRIDLGRSFLSELISQMVRDPAVQHSSNYQRMVDLMRRSAG